jgi:hypothetical protein
MDWEKVRAINSMKRLGRKVEALWHDAEEHELAKVDEICLRWLRYRGKITSHDSESETA